MTHFIYIRRILGTWGIVVLVYTGIFWLSHQAGLRSDFSLISDIVLRKGAHMVEFALLYISLVWALWFWTKKATWDTYSRLSHATSYAFIGGLIAILSDEFHQMFVYGRTAGMQDIGFDMLGLFLGYVVVVAFWYIHKRSGIYK
ncbi:MAG: VanZ family protein [Candidatus Paceibacteria bacterium]